MNIEKSRIDKAICCLEFQKLVDNAGNRGLSILVTGTPMGILCVLQSRGVAFSDHIAGIGWRDGIPKMSVNISSDVGIQYCPFCGCKIDTLVIDSPDVFFDLAQEHRRYVSADIFETWVQQN
jgi:hypothetical protein